MKYKIIYNSLTVTPPLIISSISVNKKEFNLIQVEAIVNDTNNTNNFTIIIIGMIIVILILVGAVIFAPKK